MVVAVVGDAVDAEGVAVAASFSWATLPCLGVGLGFRSPFLHDLFSHRASIGFLEIVADHYMDPIPMKRSERELLGNNFPLIPHGLAMSLGSAEGLDESYLRQFANLVHELNPSWCSDHIAFTRASGIDIGHLTPLPKTRVALRVLRDNIRRFQESIGTPLILENITESIRYPEDEYSEAEFLCEVCMQNDVGLLLDVTNLYINSINHRFCATDVLRRLPDDRIVQLHFVGGHIEEGVWIDSHSAATQQEIWELLEEVLAYAKVKGILLERDEQIPPLVDLIPELERASGLLEQSTTRRVSSLGDDRT